MTVFPFDAVVGQEDAKLALRLAAVDPRIGGVLLRGEKGSAKTTLVRGFAVLLGDMPFVELPLGATEDRVVGSLDTRAALVDGEVRFHPGLLASAHGGVLYVDEINLLADHLVDVLLDVAVSGENVVERDGISHRHPAHFVLVGSMNPEEGELRPQLLDRFGLCVDIRASSRVDERVESVRRRIEFDATGSVSAEDTTPVVTADLEPAALPDDVLVAASRLALEVGAEGLRADLVLSRAAAALAALEAREEAGVDDLRRVAPLVLAHRSRRGPFDPPVLPPEDLDRAVRSALDMDRSAADGDRDAGSGDPPSGGPPDQPIVLGSVRRPPTPPAERGVSPRGRVIGDASAATGGSVAVLPTVRALAARRATGADPNSAVAVDDLRSSLRVSKRSRTIVLCVDLSGSMGAPERAAAATGTVLGLLGDAYERRDRVALVGFRGDGAEVLVSPTSSVEVARNRLEQLATGGATPLAEGVLTALQVARAQPPDTDVLLALLTDGRATGSGGFDRALDAAGAVRRAGVPSIVLDCESGARPLGLALQLADAMHARHVFVHELQPEHLTRAIRASVS